MISFVLFLLFSYLVIFILMFSPIQDTSFTCSSCLSGNQQKKETLINLIKMSLVYYEDTVFFDKGSGLTFQWSVSNRFNGSKH